MAVLDLSNRDQEGQAEEAQVDGGVPDEGETGYDDEYNLEELEIVAADFVKKVAVVDFKEAWSTIGADHEVIETFSLSYPSLKQAMDAVTDYLGLQPCDNTGAIPAEGARTHTVLLSGIFLGGVELDQTRRPLLALPGKPLDFFASLFSLCLFPRV